jgi:hypothetical protein
MLVSCSLETRMASHPPIQAKTYLWKVFQSVFLLKNKNGKTHIEQCTNKTIQITPANRSPPCAGFVASVLLTFRANPAITRPT